MCHETFADHPASQQPIIFSACSSTEQRVGLCFPRQSKDLLQIIEEYCVFHLYRTRPRHTSTEHKHSGITYLCCKVTSKNVIKFIYLNDSRLQWNFRKERWRTVFLLRERKGSMVALSLGVVTAINIPIQEVPEGFCQHKATRAASISLY